jgi:hypothetical protein
MKPVSTVTIEMYEHKNEKSHRVEYLEYAVFRGGKEIYRIKATPQKWSDSQEPLRVFELWLMDNRSYRVALRFAISNVVRELVGEELTKRRNA